MGVLTFPFAEIVELMRESESATERDVTLGQLEDVSLLMAGCTLPEGGIADPADVDPTKVPPGLMLVGDVGIYLMSNAKRPKKQSPVVVFAKECNPLRMSAKAWLAAKLELYGGDDGADFVDLAMLKEIEAELIGKQIPFEQVCLKLIIHDTSIDLRIVESSTVH